MGNKFEVSVYQEIDGTHQYALGCCTEDMDVALEYMFAAKAEGFGCIKLEWRP